MAIKHSFVSTVSDSPGDTKVGKDRWNAAHTIEAGSIVTASIADGAITTGKIATGTIVNDDISGSAAISLSKVNIVDQLTSDHLANAAVGGVLGAIPIVYIFTIPGTASSTVSIVVTNKVRIIDAWHWHTAGADKGVGQINLSDDGDVFGYILSSTATDSSGTVNRLWVMDGGYRDIDAGKALAAITVDTKMAGQLYVMCYRLA